MMHLVIGKTELQKLHTKRQFDVTQTTYLLVNAAGRGGSSGRWSHVTSGPGLSAHSRIPEVCGIVADSVVTVLCCECPKEKENILACLHEAETSSLLPIFLSDKFLISWTSLAERACGLY